MYPHAMLEVRVEDCVFVKPHAPRITLDGIMVTYRNPSSTRDSKNGAQSVTKTRIL